MSAAAAIDWPSTLPVWGDSHTTTARSRASEVTMDSKRVRRRRMHLAPFKTVDVVWNFTADEYAAFEAFVLTDLENASLCFNLYSTEETAIAGCPITTTTTYGFLPPFYRVEHADNHHIVKSELEIVSIVVAPAPGPEDATNLTLTSPSSGNVTFGFDVGSDSVSAIIQRKDYSESAPEWVLRDTVLTPTAGTYSINDTVTPGVEYGYRVKLLNACGESEYTAELKITSGGVPAAPVLTLASIVFPTVNLSWTQPPDSDTYEVERMANISGTWASAGSTTDPVITFADTPATDTDWYYRVKAVNVAGDSPWSNWVRAELSTLVNLDAAELTGYLNGDAISTWDDEGPRESLVYQPTAGYRPTFVYDFNSSGNPAVGFSEYATYDRPIPTGVVNAVGHFLFSDLSGDLDNGMTIFLVGGGDGTITDYGRSVIHLDVGGTNELILETGLVTGGAGKLWIKSGGSWISQESLTGFCSEAGPHLFTFRIQSSPLQMKYWLDGVLVLTGTTPTGAQLDTLRSPMYMGADGGFDDANLQDLFVQELLIKNRAVDNTEIATMMSDLMTKWGI